VTIIGINGFARSGKDTIASILVERYGFRHEAIADPIKRLALASDPSLRRMVDGFGWDHVKTAHSGVRDRLQALGAAIRAEWGDTFLIVEILGGVLEDERVVISDVRTPEEAREVRDWGGFVFRVERPYVGPANRDYTERLLAPDLIDHTFHNEGAIGDLVEQVNRFFESEMGKTALYGPKEAA